MADNSIQLEKDLKLFLYQLRIDAEVHIEEMVRCLCFTSPLVCCVTCVTGYCMCRFLSSVTLQQVDEVKK